MESSLSGAPLIPLETRHVVVSPHARLYAFSDNHGFFPILKSSLDIIDRDIEENPLRHKQDVYVLNLGDLINKGPDSKKCVELYSDYAGSREKDRIFTHSLMGNHEKGLIDFLNGPKIDQGIESWVLRSINWIRDGGYTALKSYGVPAEHLEPFRDIKKQNIMTRETLCGRDLWAALASPAIKLMKLRQEFADTIEEAGHLGFYRNLQTTVSSQHFVFCHARINPLKNVSDHAIDEVVTGRDIVNYGGSFKNGAVVVYGHSPGKNGKGCSPPRLKPTSIGIDPCAFRNGTPFVMALDKGGVVRFLFDGNREVGPVLYKHHPTAEVAAVARKSAEVTERPGALSWRGAVWALRA